MAFWWPLLALAIANGIYRFILILLAPGVPSINVNVSAGSSFFYSDGQTMEGGSINVGERVALARKAQKVWAKSSFKQRKQFLRILLKYIIEHQELICQISSRDTGKTMVDTSVGEIITTCGSINWLLSEGEKCLKPEYRSSGWLMLYKTSKVEFHPLGLVGAIISGNSPFHDIFNPLLAAVFSGNGIVIKVSDRASRCGCFYLQIIRTALEAVGAPENLVDVIAGFDEAEEALVSSVDKIIFVGSPDVGKKIIKKTSEILIPVTLQLGGKDAFIVCEDADVKHVAHIAGRVSIQSSGQNCARAERFYVHADIYNAFVSQVVKNVTAGPLLAGNDDMGASCLQVHAEKLQRLVNDALDKNTEIAGRACSGNLGTDAVDHTMQIMHGAFEPIMPIMKFHSDEEVIRLANDSRYGLGCAVFSGNQSRAKRIASQLHCGTTAVNDLAPSYVCQSLPFGGMKNSGYRRFAAIEGLRACCLIQSVVQDRWWPYIKTKIPMPIQYPVADNAFEFQQLLLEAFYGLNILDRLRAWVNVRKVLKQNAASPGRVQRDN